VAHLRKLELRVPRDISIANISGKPVEPVLDVDLTTAVPPNQQIVETALDLLAAYPAGDETKQYSFKPDFHVGGSTARCPTDPQRMPAARPSTVESR
jgi:DNA-binding LacI/PurR family transcriptional regulator